MTLVLERRERRQTNHYQDYKQKYKFLQALIYTSKAFHAKKIDRKPFDSQRTLMYNHDKNHPLEFHTWF